MDDFPLFYVDLVNPLAAFFNQVNLTSAKRWEPWMATKSIYEGERTEQPIEQTSHMKPN